MEIWSLVCLILIGLCQTCHSEKESEQIPQKSSHRNQRSVDSAEENERINRNLLRLLSNTEICQGEKYEKDSKLYVRFVDTQVERKFTCADFHKMTHFVFASEHAGSDLICLVLDLCQKCKNLTMKSRELTCPSIEFLTLKVEKMKETHNSQQIKRLINRQKAVIKRNNLDSLAQVRIEEMRAEKSAKKLASTELRRKIRKKN